jgi:hypothetical protein
MKAAITFITKGLKWTFTGVSVGLVGTSIYFYAQTIAPKSFQEMPEQDKKSFTYLSQIYKVDKSTPNQLWNKSWEFHKKPLVLISKKKEKDFFYQTIYLINMSAHQNMKDYEKVEFPKEMDLEDVYVTRWYNINILLNFFANFTFLDPSGRWNLFDETRSGNEFFSFNTYPTQFDTNRVFTVMPYFLVHEAFHLQQYKEKWLYDKTDQAPYGEHIDNYPYLPEHYALLKKEYDLLDTAFENLDNTSTLKNTMQQWVEIREQRYAKWPQLKKETNSETIEGTAKYLEEKLHQLGMFPHSPILAATDDHTGKFLQNLRFSDFLKFAMEVNPQILERYLAYDKGAVMSLILNELDPLWKEKVGKKDDTGTMPTLYELIKIALKVK